VPEAVFALPRLRALNVSASVCLSDASHCSLQMHSNRIASLPHTVGRLTALTDLNVRAKHRRSALWLLLTRAHMQVSHNLLSSLPREVGLLQSLKCLNVLSNSLATLPAELGSLQALTHLWVRAIVAPVAR
jgi:leucine-rich repeat protein SHOC2